MPAAAARALRPRATRMPLIAMTAVQALCRMAKTIPDQLMNEMLIMNIRGSRAGSFGHGISAAFSVRTAIFWLKLNRQELGAHYKKIEAKGGRVRTREWKWPCADWSEAC